MRKPLKYYCCLILLMATTLLYSCQQKALPTASPAAGMLPKLAVLPFENYSSDPNAGLVIMSSLQTALEGKKANIENAGTVREKLMAYEGSYLPPQKLGKILNADAVVCGAVSEYRYVYGTGEQPSLSYSVRVIDVHTGGVLWSKAVSSSGNFSWIHEGSLGETAKSSAASVAPDILKALSKTGSHK